MTEQLKDLHKEYQNFIRPSTQVIQASFEIALSQVELFCPNVRIPWRRML